MNEIEDAVRQASTVVSDELCNTEKLLSARQTLANVKPQVDSVEANVWSNPETIETVTPILEEYTTLVDNIEKKLANEVRTFSKQFDC